jgi:hypothetical protein
MIARFLPFKHSNARDGKISISDRALPPFQVCTRVFSQDIVDVSVSGANPAGRKPPVSELQKMQCIKEDDAQNERTSIVRGSPGDHLPGDCRPPDD